MARATERKGDPLAAAARELSAARREMTLRSPQVFMEVYLRHLCPDKPSPMHRAIFARLERASRQRGLRLAVAAPRGHAKSTIVSQAYVLWCVCHRLEEFIVLVGSSSDQAADMLALIKRELESNPLLIADFPGVCEVPGVRPSAERWRKEDIITRSGVRVRALGPDGRIRGRKHGAHRPTLIIVDDIETEAQASSADQRERRWSWLMRSVLQAGAPTANVVVVGTILHYDSALARLLDPGKVPGWERLRYAAVVRFADDEELWARWERVYHSLEEIDGAAGPAAARKFFTSNKRAMLKGAKALWPGRESYYDLMVIRERDGRAAFHCEKQNDPVSGEDRLFPEEEIVYWDGGAVAKGEYANEAELLGANKGALRLYGACDPSLGRQGKHGDRTAIVVIAALTRAPRTRYVLVADIATRKPDATLEAIMAYQKQFNCSQWAMETNQFQDFLADELTRRSRERGDEIPIRRITHTGDKLGRIQSLQPKVKSGGIRFSRRHRRLLDEMLQFPKGAHDDGLDALEMAVFASRTYEGSGCFDPTVPRHLPDYWTERSDYRYVGNDLWVKKTREELRAEGRMIF